MEFNKEALKWASAPTRPARARRALRNGHLVIPNCSGVGCEAAKRGWRPHGHLVTPNCSGVGCKAADGPEGSTADGIN